MEKPRKQQQGVEAQEGQACTKDNCNNKWRSNGGRGRCHMEQCSKDILDGELNVDELDKKRI